MAVTYTARTKATLARATAAQFSTTSATYVDVTGLSLSVPNNYYYSCFVSAGADTSGQAAIFQLVENVTNKRTDLKTTAGNGANTAGNVWFLRYQNTSGSSQTVKLQIKASSGTAYCMADSFIYSASTNTYSEGVYFFANGNCKMPIKVNLDTIDIAICSCSKSFGLYAQSSFNQLTRDANQYNIQPGQFSVANVNIMGKQSISCTANEDLNADAFVTVTIDNIVTDGISFLGTDSGNSDAGYGMKPHSMIFMVWDYSGTQIEVT